MTLASTQRHSSPQVFGLGMVQCNQIGLSRDELSPFADIEQGMLSSALCTSATNGLFELSRSPAAEALFSPCQERLRIMIQESRWTHGMDGTRNSQQVWNALVDPLVVEEGHLFKMD